MAARRSFGAPVWIRAPRADLAGALLSIRAAAGREGGRSVGLEPPAVVRSRFAESSVVDVAGVLGDRGPVGRGVTRVADGSLDGARSVVVPSEHRTASPVDVAD